MRTAGLQLAAASTPVRLTRPHTIPLACFRCVGTQAEVDKFDLMTVATDRGFQDLFDMLDEVRASGVPLQP